MLKNRLNKGQNGYVSLLLVGACALFLITLGAAQLTNQSTPTTHPSDILGVDVPGDFDLSGELLDLASPTTRHFRQPDGNVSALISGSPRWYQTPQGSWATINTAIEETSTGFVSDRNSFSIQFPRHNRDDLALSGPGWNAGYSTFEGMDFVSEGEATANTLIYSGVRPGADEEFVVTSGQLKHNLVVHGRQPWLTQTPTLINRLSVSSGLTALLNGMPVVYETPMLQGQSFRFVNSEGETAFELLPPMAYERNARNEQTALPMSLELTGGGNYIIRTGVPADWMMAPGRNFPVVIDPIMVIQPSAFDAHIDLKNPTVNNGALDVMIVRAKTNQHHRILVQFDLTSLPANVCVNSVALELFTPSAQKDDLRLLDLHRTTTPWVEATTTWNDSDTGIPWITPGGGADFNATIESQVTTDGIDANWEIFAGAGLTQLVQDWNDAVFPNYGFLIKDNLEDNPNKMVVFASREGATPTEHPLLRIDYTGVTVTISESACAGLNTTLTATPSGGVLPYTSYLWAPGGATTTSITVPGDGVTSYTCTVTDSGSCPGTSAPYTVQNCSVPSCITSATNAAGGPTIFCAGGSVTLTASADDGTGPFTYLWSPGGATTVLISATASGTYSCDVTDNDGACGNTVASNSIVVTVNALPAVPTITPDGPTTFCAGGSVNLASSAAVGYLWAPGGETTQTINVSASGTYSVTITDGNGCQNTSAGTVVTVNALPAVPTITPDGPTTFCAGGSVNLASSAAVGYLWAPGGETTQTINVSATGTYSVTITDGNGCQNTSAGEVVTVNALPAMPTITPDGPTTFCAGGSVNLASSAAVGYLWAPGGETTQTINVSASGTYSVIITDGNGCQNSSAGEVVTVNALPTPTITESACALGMVDLSVGAYSSYLWAPGGATTQTINVPGDGTMYTVTVTDGNGCLGNDSLVTTICGACISSATNAAGGATTFCDGGSVTLTASADDGTGPFTYLWSPGGETTNSILVLASGTYSCDVTDNDGACGNTVASNSIVVTVNALPAVPTITPDGPTTFCAGGSVNLASSASVGYLWAPGGETTQTINVSATGTYSVTITDGNGCQNTSAGEVVTVNALPAMPTITPDGPTTFCAGGSVNLASSASVGYLWAPGGETTQTINVSASGTYSVTITDGNGCQNSSAGEVVTVNALPTPTITESACALGNVTLDAGVYVSYLWAPGGATTQTINVLGDGTMYTVTVTDGNGCSGNDSLVTTICGACVTSATNAAGGATTFCDGGSVTLTASADDGVGPFTYLWSPGGETTNSILVLASGTYSCDVTDNDGACGNTVASNSIVVTVNALPAVPTITPDGPTTFCAGGSVNLASSAAVGYLWAPGGETTQTINVSASGTYSVTITDGNGCQNTSSGTVVTVNALPAVPTITPDGPTTFCAGGSVNLASSAAVSYLWAPGGETTQTINVLATGTYSVTITDGNGCQNTSAGTVVTVNALPAVPTITPTNNCPVNTSTLVSSPAAGYLWAPGGATLQTITVPNDGTAYTVTITDGNGCQSTSAPYATPLGCPCDLLIDPSGDIFSTPLLLLDKVQTFEVEEAVCADTYNVYEGDFGTWASYSNQSCWEAASIALGRATVIWPMSAGSHWYLVSASNTLTETRAGVDSSGVDHLGTCGVNP